MSKRFVLFLALAALLLAALPAVAAPPIQRGIDTWTTIPEATYADFSNNPLPQGFFCADSPVFTGQIYLHGVPLATDKGLLGRVDTIVERLDDAAFNRRGVAVTRVQVRALQLTGVETFKNACGEYKVFVTLDGEQPISRMQIVRDNNKGGRFMVPLSVNTKIIFVRVDNEAERLEFADPVHFPANPFNRWSYRAPEGKRLSPVMVDTDWDGTPDTALPGQSNFAPGLRDGLNKTVVLEGTHAVKEAAPVLD